jgi:hypothetical protein
MDRRVALVRDGEVAQAQRGAHASAHSTASQIAEAGTSAQATRRTALNEISAVARSEDKWWWCVAIGSAARKRNIIT